MKHKNIISISAIAKSSALDKRENGSRPSSLKCNRRKKKLSEYLSSPDCGKLKLLLYCFDDGTTEERNSPRPASGHEMGIRDATFMTDRGYLIMYRSFLLLTFASASARAGESSIKCEAAEIINKVGSGKKCCAHRKTCFSWCQSRLHRGEITNAVLKHLLILRR